MEKTNYIKYISCNFADEDFQIILCHILIFWVFELHFFKLQDLKNFKTMEYIDLHIICLYVKLTFAVELQKSNNLDSHFVGSTCISTLFWTRLVTKHLDSSK